MADLAKQFLAATEAAQALTRRPSDADLLQLYALYKQATVGDARGPRPGLLDLRGRAKYDAWAAQQGVSPEDAKRAYVALVARLKKHA